MLLLWMMKPHALIGRAEIVKKLIRARHAVLEERQNPVELATVYPERRDAVAIPVRGRRRDSQLGFKRLDGPCHSALHLIHRTQVDHLLPDGSFDISQRRRRKSLCAL